MNPAAALPATAALVTMFASVEHRPNPGDEWGPSLRRILAVFATEEQAAEHASSKHAWNRRAVEEVKCVMVDGVAFPLYGGFTPGE